MCGQRFYLFSFIPVQILFPFHHVSSHRHIWSPWKSLGTTAATLPLMVLETGQATACRRQDILKVSGSRPCEKRKNLLARWRKGGGKENSDEGMGKVHRVVKSRPFKEGWKMVCVELQGFFFSYDSLERREYNKVGPRVVEERRRRQLGWEMTEV